jgi:uracil-DNA glycosylase family 4
MPRVPNRKPTLTSANYRIAVIGEAPGGDEEQYLEPFIGPSGHVLRNLMSNSDIHPDATLLANVCQYRPPNNNFNAFPPQGSERTESLAHLSADINEFNPNIVVLCGDHALALAGVSGHKVTTYRGTIFRCEQLDSPLYGRKCIATIHPAAALRQHSYLPLIRLDLAKARKEGEFPELNLPNPTLDIHLTLSEQIERLREIRRAGMRVSLDIEGDISKNFITCLSFATSKDYAFSMEIKGTPLENEVQLMQELNLTLRDPNVEKILQNSLFDNHALSWIYGAFIANVEWDTMLSGWEIYPELPKNLATQTSIWTGHPYYKDDRTKDDWQTHLRYCCRDSVVTYEIAEKHRQVLNANPSSLSHFRMNMDLLKVMMYMQLRGTKYDSDGAKLIAGKCHTQLKMINDRINAIAGHPVNINSPKQLCKLFYDELKFPKQYAKDTQSKKGGLTTNVSAILNLQKSHQDRILVDILSYRKVDKVRVYSSISHDPDGRVRCGYNVVGTDTGRVSCYTASHGTGTNIQVITKKLRGLYRADEGHHYFQIDLAGADGWTVAAHCARLGDRTMLDDYLFGLKPAKIIALMSKDGEMVNTWSREDIKSKGREIGNGDTEWLYFACKRVQHGTNYGLGARTMSGQILQDGYKYLGQTIIVPEADCKRLQRLYSLRYPGVAAWQSWIKQQLMSKGGLHSASGAFRRFFGKPNDIKTIQAAYAHEPQSNTTYATNLGMQKLWNDPENRRSDGRLIIEPLHQVHDALNGQFPITETEWAVQKLRSYMDNPLIIAGQSITIPYEGAYGPSWGDCDANYGTPVGTI